MAQAKTEGELMYGMMGMDVEPQEPIDISEAKVSARQLKKDKKKARDARLKQEMLAAKAPAKDAGEMELDVDQKKEADFAAFLANVGGESMPLGLISIMLMTSRFRRGTVTPHCCLLIQSH